MQEVELIAHLHEVTSLTAKAVAAYVFEEYGLQYTISGITKWFERNEFVYKKPKHIPSKFNEQKQQEFINYYEQLKQITDNVDSIIMFMDAIHLEYQSQVVYGWTPKGETKTLSTTNTQFRLHLNGAIDLHTMNIVIKQYDTIDAQSIISFFKDLEAKHQYKIIHIIYSSHLNLRNYLV